MSGLPTPGALFNPLTSSPPLSPVEIFAGPFGLLAFLPLIPVVLLVARRWPRAALILGGLAWLLPTLQATTTLVLLAGVAAATVWVVALAALRRHGRLGRRTMIGLVWIGVHALVLPLWWQAQQAWYPSRMAVLHNVGFSYFLFRFVAWGVNLANDPVQPLRLTDTICWLLYPPCMRLGPILLREDFLARFDAWNPRRRPGWKEGFKRFGLFLVGGAGIGLIGQQLEPLIKRGNFFAAPQEFTTSQLLMMFYFVPIQVYLLLWTYNELAVAVSHWVGIRVDDNFCRLPLATSVRDFWRRWHITVGAWLRNYIYIPLGGSRRHITLNTIAVFAYCGIWHGASWSFLAWGLAQAVGLIVQRGWDGLRARSGWSNRPSGWAWTAVCWVLTMHFQIATIVTFTDFHHLGVPLFRELARRLAGLAG